jgi:lysozyme
VACGGGATGGDEPTGTTSEALQQCPGSTVEGIDIYDGTGTINWGAVKGAGVDFAMIKATQGTYNTQATFSTNWSGSKAAGVVRAAYHFFDPTEDGTAQAQHFLSVVGTLGPGDLPAMLDIECPDGDPNCMYQGGSGAAAASDITTRMWNWIHTVEQATGKKPIIYTFGSYFSSNGIDTTGLGAYPLFIAYPTSASCFNVPAPWSTAVIWQYSWTGTVNGISVQVDRDRFIGTLADLQAFAQGSGSNVLPHVNGNDALTVVNWPSDGHAELFLTTQKGTAQHVYTNADTDTWTQVYDYTGSASCGLASVMWPTSSWGAYAELFDPKPGGAGADTQHLYFGSGGWTSFADYGGPGLMHLSTVVGADGHAEVYGLAPDGSIQANAWDLSKGAWGGWQSLGGKLATGAAPIVWNDGHIELFATDAQGAAWHDWTSNGKWGGWQSLGGQLAQRPIPVRWADGHVEIFARGIDGHTYSSPWNKTWAPFTAIESSTTIAGDVSAVVNPSSGGGTPGPELFARATAGQVVHMTWNGKPGASWAPLGTQTVASDPLGWVRADGKEEVFAVDASGNVVKSYRDATGAWSTWATIASGIDPCVESAPIAGDGGSGGPAGDGGAPGPGPSGGSDAGGPDNNAAGGASGGCGCRVASESTPTSAGWAIGAVAATLVFASRRRRSGSIDRHATAKYGSPRVRREPRGSRQGIR